MSYKFLLFDLDHTLLDFALAEEVALTELLTELKVADVEAFKAVYKPLNQGLWKDLEKGLITKKELVNTRFSRTFAQFGQEVDGAALALRYQEFLGQQGQTFAGAVELLAELESREYQLYAATNGVTAIQENRLQNSDILPFFKEVFISEQLGTQKPEPLFYEKIAERIPGFAKEATLMIGDSLTADIAGGNRAGIDTVWYNRDCISNTSPAQPTYTIATYDQLLQLLP